MSPITALKTPEYKQPKIVEISWDTFKGGVNTFLEPYELKSDELVEARNLMLTGSGVPIKRWGSANYFLAGSGSVRHIRAIKDADDTIEVLALTDAGYLAKKSGASYENITGFSWASGTIIDTIQLAGNVYCVSDTKRMARYDFDTLIGFATLTEPTGLTATQLSSASGLNAWSYRVTALGLGGGETTGSDNVLIENMPQDLTKTLIRLNWTAVSAASGDLVGYNVFRGTAGDEIFIGNTDASTTSLDDPGLIPASIFNTVPDANTTGGPKGKYIIRYQDRLIVAGIPGEPSKILVSGRYPDQERFDWYVGGGFTYIEKESGETVTGLGIYQEKLIVFKENSVWELKLNLVDFGYYSILDPRYTLLTASQGCLSHKTIQPVENDLIFANRNGLYILRYEPQLLTVINANEISQKISPYFEGISDADHKSASAVYTKNKYVLSYPIAKESILFDRERLAIMGPWTTPFGVYDWEKYTDAAGDEIVMAADSDDAYVTKFSNDLIDDKGTAIWTILKTRKENMGAWSTIKSINEIFYKFTDVSGEVQVNVYIENRFGRNIVAKSFTITSSAVEGSSALGTDLLGDFLLGDSDNDPGTLATNTEIKKNFIYKLGRTIQIEVKTNNRQDSYQLESIKINSHFLPEGSSPSTWRV